MKFFFAKVVPNAQKASIEKKKKGLVVKTKRKVERGEANKKLKDILTDSFQVESKCV